MTITITCDKCGTQISNDNLNVPGHSIVIDNTQHHVCDPCFKENDYEHLLTGGIDLTTGRGKTSDS